MAEDKRIRKTKQRLTKALAELLAQTSFEQITVKDICAQSSITRITFYTHYGDKYELLADLFRDMEILTKAQALTETVIGIDPSLEFFEHRGIREQLESFWEKAVTASGLSG